MLRRRTPRFSRTQMNESSYYGSADYGKFAYSWYMIDAFEMTDELNKQIQKLMKQNSNLPNVSKLQDLLSDTFDTKMGIISCSVRTTIKEFSLTFTGRNVLFEITVYF